MSEESTLIATTAQGSTDAGTGKQDGGVSTTAKPTEGGAGGEGGTQSEQGTKPGETGTLLDGGEELKSEEGKPGEGDKAKEGEGAEPPAEYADFTAPEGVTLDGEVSGDLKSLAKELKLSQEQAQKIADLGVKLQQRSAQAQTEAVAQARSKWAADAKVDKEIGGDKLPETLSIARKALDAFGSPELRTLLTASGLGSHPEVIRLLARAGKAISEDTVVSGQRNASPTSAKDLYTQSQMN